MMATVRQDSPLVETGVSRKMTVTVFYPDAQAGAYLVKSVQGALQAAGDKDTLDPRPWRLDILSWPEMQVQAMRDIATSEMILVPVDYSYACSPFFRFWAETWPDPTCGPCLLLALRGRVSESAPSIQAFLAWLKRLADRKGMDFALGGVPFIESNGGGAQGGASRATAGSGVENQSQHRSLANTWQGPPELRFWGLNE